jgi:hypothetical protein
MRLNRDQLNMLWPMNNQSKLRISVFTILTVFATIAATAQPPPRAVEKNGPPAAPGSSLQPTAVDPATGLPIPPAPPAWKDPEWKDPEKKLTVSYEGVPVSEVAADLRKQFNDAFDILIPRSAPVQVVGGIEAFDVPGMPIQIRLKDVSASEVFNALNLLFEAENTPLSWQLKMNGNRPMALLRVRPEVAAPPVRTETPQRKIFFVGELLAGEKSGMSMEQLVKTISEIYEMSYTGGRRPGADHLQFHKDAQLLVVTGSSDEIEFIAETIAALKQKVEHSAAQAPVGSSVAPVKTEPKAKADKSKSP